MLNFLQITFDILKFSFCYSKKNILPLSSEIFYIYLTTHCGFPDGSVIKSPPAMQEAQIQSLSQKIPWRRKWLPTPVFLPENPMHRGAWWATVNGITRVGPDLAPKQQQLQTTYYLNKERRYVSFWSKHST